MNQLLAECGEALYGSRWQSEVARDLGCNIRTMQRWAAGTHVIPDGVWPELLRMTQDRADLLNALADRLKRPATSS